MVRVVLIVLALLLAAAAGWMVKLYLTSQKEQLAQWAQSQKPKPLPTTEVLVAAGAVDITTTIAGNNLRWQAWPDTGLHERYITRRARPDAMEKLSGAIARQPLFAGEPITEDKLLLKQEGGFLAAVMPDGGRAIALKVDEASGVAGLVLPGDHVDIILTHDIPVRDDERGAGAVTKRFVSETIVGDLRVLAVDQDLKHEDKDSAKVGRTVTVAVSAAQAEAVALGRAMGNLTLSLRSAFGKPPADERGQPYTSTFDISEALRAEKAKAAATPSRPEPPRPRPAGPYTVTVFHGLMRETVTLGR